MTPDGDSPPLRHMKALQGLIQEIVEGFHQQKNGGRVSGKEFRMIQLFIGNRIFDCPAFMLQVFTDGKRRIIFPGDIFQFFPDQNKLFCKGWFPEDRFPLRPVETI